MMTREEVIEILENGGWWELLIPITTIEGRIEEDKLHEAITFALTALRPVSREQVEKVWRGEWIEEIVKRCNWKGEEHEYYQPWSCSKCHRTDPQKGRSRFCVYCGAPMTGEAVDMVIKRLEARHEKT